MTEYIGAENLEIMADAVNYNRFLVSLIQNEVQEDNRIVDFGAGIGTFAKSICKEGLQVHCVELDTTQRMRILGSGLSASADISSLDDGSVDVVYTLNVLEHIEDDIAMLKLLCQKIRPGGRILIYVPAFPILYSSMDKKVGHFRRYIRAELSIKVMSAGFEIINSEYVDCLGFIASLLFKVFGNENGTLNRNALIIYDRFVFPLSRLLDYLFNGLFGKNVFIVARRPGQK